MDFKYEVAFSLVEENKEVGRQINNLIKSKFKTFIYFENKTEVAAQNGLYIFYNIFNNESRIVVILYSDKWGKTDWTNKEEIAIQERIVKNNWDFLIFVKLDKKIITPKWYPNPNIYVNFEDYGISGVASVIENKLRELGGKIKNETIEEKAQRISEERSNIIKIKQTLDKEYLGIGMANEEVKILFGLVKKKIINLSKVAEDLFFKTTLDENFYIQLQIQYYILNIRWYPSSINFLEGSHLDFNLKKRNIKKYPFDNHFDDITTISYLFDINPSWINGWKEDRGKDKFFATEQLLDYWIKIILEEIEKNEIY